MSNLKQVLASFNRAREDLINELENNTYLAWLHLEQAVKKLTPVEHGTLQGSIVTTDPEFTGTSITVQVGTNLDYAPYVEFGRSKKGLTNNYHKWTRVFKANSVGAQMFQIWNKEEQLKIRDIIKNWW